MRSLIFGLVAVVALSLIAESSLSQEHPHGELFLLEMKPMAISDDEPELMRLLKSRFNAAKEESDTLVRTYLGGKATPPLGDVFEAMKRFCDAGAELATSQEERINYYRGRVEICRVLERVIRDKHENEIEPRRSVRLAEYYRYDAEIALYRAQHVAKQR